MHLAEVFSPPMMHCSQWFSLLWFWTLLCYSSSEDGTCDDSISARNCEQLFKVFEQSLLSDGGNVYKIRNLLFPPIGNIPELAEITFQLNSIEIKISNRSLSDDELMHPCTENDTVFFTNATTMRYGWTTIGLYTYIHPALLNQLQPQLPFALMRLVAPIDVPFLWDGCNQLPSVTIDLSVPLNNLTCAPSLPEVNEALKILTAHVCV